MRVVSTIHKAKGKEWRTVLLPRLFEGLCPASRQEQPLGTTESPEGISQSDPLEQERRIFYVGLTRASETVYLEVPEQDPSRFIAEIEPPKPVTSAPRRATPAKKAAARKPASAPNEGKPWSAADDAALADARAAGATLDDLAERFGRSRDAIDAHLVIVESKRRRAEARWRALEEDDD